MAEKTSQTAFVGTLEYPVRVEVRPAKFEPYSSLQDLDVAKLGKGNHKVEVGIVKGGCCGLKAFAIIKAGMVVATKFEPCPESKRRRLSKNQQALVNAAYKKIAPQRPKWVPVSIEDFFGKRAVSRLKISLGGGCLEVCWGDATPESPKVCVTCCAAEKYIVCDVSSRVEVKWPVPAQ